MPPQQARTADRKRRPTAEHDRGRAEVEGLTRAAQGGDRKALEELVRRHQGQVLRFGQRMCRNTDDAEEVLQDTFLAMTRTIDGFRGDASFSSWLYTIARSFCIKKRRRSKYAPAHIESIDGDDNNPAPALPDPGRPPDERVAAAEVQAALDAAIAELRPMYREVLVLRDIEGLTAPEVGEVLGLTVQAVKSRLHRAREQVRAQVAPLLQPELAAEPGTRHCARTARLFSRHLEGEIDAATCATMEKHVAECPHCSAVCSTLRATLAACRREGAQSPKVPKHVQQAVRRALSSYLKDWV